MLGDVRNTGFALWTFLQDKALGVEDIRDEKLVSVTQRIRKNLDVFPRLQAQLQAKHTFYVDFEFYQVRSFREIMVLADSCHGRFSVSRFQHGIRECDSVQNS